jgi:hypothetical protein
MGQVLSVGARLDAIARLLDLGAIRTEFLRVTAETFATDLDVPPEQLVRYVATPFGSVLFDYVIEQMGVTDPELRDKLQRMAQDDDKHS